MPRAFFIVAVAAVLAGCGDRSSKKQRTATLQTAEPIMSSAALEQELDAIEKQIQR